MKKIALLFTMMFLPMVSSAQTASDVQNSGCLNESRGVESQRVPTIILTKEGNILSVQLLNYESNCCTEYFDATYGISGSSDGGLCSVSINVAPVAELDCDCICPFNVSFTIRDLEPNRFYLDCWWYKGMVNLTEGKPLVLDGQERDYYYYYQGNKIPLTLNENKVVVSVPKESDGISKRIRANVPFLITVKDEVFDTFIIYRSDFEKLTSQSFWEEDAKSVVLSSSYYTEDNEEVFATPYLNVKLKKKEDAELLERYADKYGLRNLGSFSQNLPLWYVLYITPQSGKSPLECANELFESGRFASSVPDFSSFDHYEGGAYRPFVEDGKVWVIKGSGISPYGDPLEPWIEYCYFDGDTIIGGQACKQMKCISNDAPSPLYIGAWYEQDKKVYFADNRPQFELLYDFTLSSDDSFSSWGYPVVVKKTSGAIPGFKGTYYDLWRNDKLLGRWLEGVGCNSWPNISHPWDLTGGKATLLLCRVGDEVIYYDSEESDSYVLGARKQRIDFTHTIKIRPRARTMVMVEPDPAPSLSGEYSEQQLGINLNPLDNAYLVRITDETGKTVYEKTVNAGNIVGLNIDISAYAEGRYTVTVENDNESFTGDIDTRTTGISLTPTLSKREGAIYNLQGQRISSLRKGLNIVSGRKIFVK